jgi:outer membrane protein assembly factor BamB
MFSSSSRTKEEPSKKLDLPPSPYSLVWKKKVHSDGLSSPVLDDGILYVGSDKGLYAISFDSGDTLWNFKTSSPVEAPAAVQGNTVCFGTREGVFYCLERSSGEELWRYQARSEILSSALISGDTVYFNSADMKVHALSVTTGEKLWSYGRTALETVYPMFRNSPVLADDRLYLLFPDGYLVSLKAGTGRELWENRVMEEPILSDGTFRSPFIFNDHVYVIDDRGALVKIDRYTGTRKEDYRMTKAVDFTAEERNAEDQRTPFVRIFVAGREEVMAFDLLTGTVLWKSPVTSGESYTLFVKGEHLYLLTNYETNPLGFGIFKKMKGNIEAFRLSDGTPLWVKKLDGAAASQGAVYKGRIFLVTAKGTLEVFALDGKEKK